MAAGIALVMAPLTMLVVGPLVSTPAAVGPPGDQPLPGYRIVAADLEPLPVEGGPTRVLTGVHRHAGYAIEVPPNWNGGLVMWAPWQAGNEPQLRVTPPPQRYGLRERWLGQGYAWATSSADRGGYDVAAGVESTRALVDEFSRQVGEPSRVYLAGMSEGGHVVARAIEEDPGRYSGALPLCAGLGDHELLDYRLDTAVVAQALGGRSGSWPPRPGYSQAVVPQLYAGLGVGPGSSGSELTPRVRQWQAATVLASGGPRPAADSSFRYWLLFLLHLPEPGWGPSPVTGVAAEPSLVATNVGTGYAPNTPFDLDLAVQRVPVADPATRDSVELTPVAQVFGRPGVPVLTLHGIGDMYVPLAMQQVYAAEVAANGRSDLLVQRAIRTTAHCEFSAVEVGTAWDDLVAWVEGGPQPAGDDVGDPAVVADPTFGCRFTDPAAYDEVDTASPHPTNTRPLYERCPS